MFLVGLYCNNQFITVSKQCHPVAGTMTKAPEVFKPKHQTGRTEAEAQLAVTFSTSTGNKHLLHLALDNNPN